MITSTASLAGMGYCMHEGSAESEASIAAHAKVDEINHQFKDDEMISSEVRISLEQQRDAQFEIIFDDLDRRDLYLSVYGLTLFVAFAGTGVGAGFAFAEHGSKEV